MEEEKTIEALTKKIVAEGQKNGKITINQIADAIEGQDFPLEALENLYNTLEAEGIVLEGSYEYLSDGELYDGDTAQTDAPDFYSEGGSDVFCEDDPTDYLNEIKKIPRISDEQRDGLLHRIAKGDERAKKSLLESSLYLAAEIAKDFPDAKLPYLDLVQEGNLGLIEAIDTFDADNGEDFYIYAERLIKDYMAAAERELAEQTQKPLETANSLNRLMKVNDAFYKENGRSPNLTELAAAMGIEQEEVSGLMDMAKEILRTGIKDGKSDCRDGNHTH